jgi:hypothetical protein
MQEGNKVYLLDPILTAEVSSNRVTYFLRLAAMAEVKKTPGAKMSFGLEAHRKENRHR